MNTYKLTYPCTVIDIKGNVTDTENTVVFSNKEDLISFLSGDTDGDNYGCGLINVSKYDKELYKEIGLMCNRISLCFENINKTRNIPHAYELDNPDYVVRSDGSWYAQYKNGHIREAVPSRKERIRLAKHNSNLRPDGDYDGDHYDKYNNLYGTFWK